MDWYMWAWETLCSLGVPQLKSPEVWLQMMSPTNACELRSSPWRTGKYIKWQQNLESFVDTMALLTHHQQVQSTRLPRNAPYRSLPELYSFVYETFNREKELNAERARKFLNPTIKEGFMTKKEQYYEAGVAQYFSTNKLLKEYLMNDEKRVWAGICRMALDVWFGWLLAFCDQNEERTHSLTLPEPGGWNLLCRYWVEAQLGHNDFEAPKNKSSDFFAMPTGADGAVLYVDPGSHKLVLYSKAVKSTLARRLVLEHIMIPPNSVYISHGFL